MFEGLIILLFIEIVAIGAAFWLGILIGRKIEKKKIKEEMYRRLLANECLDKVYQINN